MRLHYQRMRDSRFCSSCCFYSNVTRFCTRAAAASPRAGQLATCSSSDAMIETIASGLRVDTTHVDLNAPLAGDLSTTRLLDALSQRDAAFARLAATRMLVAASARDISEGKARRSGAVNGRDNKHTSAGFLLARPSSALATCRHSRQRRAARRSHRDPQDPNERAANCDTRGAQRGRRVAAAARARH